FQAAHRGAREASRAPRSVIAFLCIGMLAACGLLKPDTPRAPVPPPPTATAPAAPAAPVAAAAAPPAATAAASHCSVVLYGDSILHGGYGGNLRLAEPPAAALKRLRPRYTVDDRSANGETATARAAGFANEKRAARFVVIAHGLNDAALSLPVEAPLRSMIATAVREGRVVIVTGLSRQRIPVPGRDQYDAAIRKVALETGAGFADWGAEEFRAAEMADILHPAGAYSQRLSMRIVQTLDRLAPDCRV
ncbi:SGNH/GDSL hydrolase family protein, partial [Variovorax paradoxus]